MLKTLKILSIILSLTALIFIPSSFAQILISYGEVKTGCISAAGEKDEFTFSGTAGERLLILYASPSPNLNPFIELYDPSGKKIQDSNSGDRINSHIIEPVLRATGSFKIIIRDQRDSQTGNYELGLYRTNSPASVMPIDFGQTTPEKLDYSAEVDVYSFSASTGEKIRVSISTSPESFLPIIILYDSKGRRLNEPVDFPGALSYTFSDSGTFYLFVTNDQENYGNGSYGLTLEYWQTPSNFMPIDFGQTLFGELTSNKEIKVYKFSGSSNDKVYIPLAKFSSSLPIFSPVLDLYDFEGNFIPLAPHGDYIYILPNSGDFYIFVRDEFQRASGPFELTLQRINNPANSIELNYNLIKEGSINNITGINVYQFYAEAQDTLTFCSTLKGITGNFGLYLELFDSFGNRLTESWGNLKYTSTTSGLFYLFVTDSNYDGSGKYRFVLSKDDFLCSDIELLNARVYIIRPKGKEVAKSGSTYNISWISAEDRGILSQEIRLSTDSGKTYPTVIASGFDNTIHSYDWLVSEDLTTTQARIKIITQDAFGNTGSDESKSDFLIVNTILPFEGTKLINYGYDKLNRLIESISDAASPIAYTYDALGNRLSISGVNSPPELSPIGNKTLDEGKSLQFILSGTDPNGDTLIYSADNLPLGATFNPETKTFSWLPNFEQAGVYSGVTFIVSDGLSSDSETVTITVNNVNRPPEAININPSSGTSKINKPVTFTTTYVDPDGWQDIKAGYFLINTSTNGAKCFYVYYDQNKNKLYLRNNSNTAWLGGYAPGSRRVITNSYAAINCLKTTVSGQGISLTVNWNVVFKLKFVGSKRMYLRVSDDSNVSSNWIKKGRWVIRH